MEAYQQRVIEEKRELDGRVAQLSEFLQTLTYSQLAGDEQERLRRQFGIMQSYSLVLGERIDAFQA